MDLKDVAKDLQKVDDKKIKDVLNNKDAQKAIDTVAEKVEKKLGVDIPSAKDIAKKI